MRNRYSSLLYRTWLGGLGLCLALLLLGSCSTGGSALPQASIPAPSAQCDGGGDCITVSSPNTQGLVTVTASAGAVPDSAVVIIGVEGTSPQLAFLFSLFDPLIPLAHAQPLCESELPECSEDAFDGQCQVTAGTDGSFRVRIPAELGEQINISYIDPNTCAEVETLDQTIDIKFLPLAVEGEFLVLGPNSTVLTLGKDSNGNLRVQEVDLTNPAQPVFTLSDVIDITGNLLSADFITFNNGDALIIVTDQETVFVDMSTDPFVIYTVDQLFLQDPTFLARHAFVQKNFTYSADELGASPCPGVPTELVGQTADRAFFAREIDTTDAEDQKHPIAILDQQSVDNQNPQVRPIRYNFESYGDRVPSLVGASLVSVEGLYLSLGSDNGAFFIAVFELSSGQQSAFFFEIPMITTLCDSRVNSDLFPELAIIEIPSELTAFGNMGIWDRSLFNNPEAFGVGLMADRVTNSLFVFDLLAESVHGNINFVALDDSYISKVTHLTRFDLTSSFPIDFAGIGERSRIVKLEFNVTTAGGFNTVSITEKETNIHSGVGPVDMRLLINSADFGQLTIDATLLILSQGIPDDGFSSLRLVPTTDLAN